MTVLFHVGGTELWGIPSLKDMQSDLQLRVSLEASVEAGLVREKLQAGKSRGRLVGWPGEKG